MNNEQLVKDLTAKDEQKAFAAAQAIIDNSNVKAFELLVEKSEFLFDFVRNNVNKRLQKAVNELNFKNLFEFLNIYTPDFEDAIVGSLAKFANEDLTDEILELLENGSEAQKTYAARYFSYIPDTIGEDLLVEYSMDDNESLAFNSAKALGVMKVKNAYENAIQALNSDDEFVVLKAVKFLVAYEDKNAINFILEAMSKSSMAENIAGEIPFLESLLTLVKEKYSLAPLCLANILSGLGEILPLSQVFNFELYDVLSFLVTDNQQNKNSQIAVVLLAALAKFEMLANNDEYTFDEDKNTKQEILEIYNLLNNQKKDFWDAQKKLVSKELGCSQSRTSNALQIIVEYEILEAIDKIKELLNSSCEITICEAVATLKQLDSLKGIDKNTVLSKISDVNQRALIESLFL